MHVPLLVAPDALEKVPAGHNSQRSAPSADHEPGPHNVQFEAPCKAYVPAAHLTQPLVAFGMEPPSHGMQKVEAFTSVRNPGEHGLQLLDPTSLKVFSGHTRHAADDTCIVTLLYFPAGHNWQELILKKNVNSQKGFQKNCKSNLCPLPIP